MTHATGKVVGAFGNLLKVKFDGAIKQGEVAFVETGKIGLKAEVIEIVGDIAKIQVFEDTKGIKFESGVSFTGHLLEAELGPGLLSGIFDGLENPLEEVAKESGYFLPRGIYVKPLCREKLWPYQVKAKVGDVVKRGDVLGTTQEGRFEHAIMVPFNRYQPVKLTWIIEPGSYNVDTIVAKGVAESGDEISFTMVQRYPIKEPLLEGEKVKPEEMLETGLRIIDTQFPIIKGGTFCTPGPFGAGKTVIQHHLSKFSSVDIVVLVACGERAGEVVEILREFPHLVDPHTGESLMKRTIIICNTSSMPVAARESSIYMGVTIAEYYRQMGLNVLLLADSTSRWAQALREMSGRLEEIPGEEAFPAYLASRIAEFYERSGVVANNGKKGSITICGAVSPAGGNFEEPVTQATLAVVGAFLGLSRERSDSRRFPAIDPILSWSKYIPQVSNQLSKKAQGWGDKVKKTEKLLKSGKDIARRMEVVGEEGTALGDMITYLKSELYDFSYLQQNAFDKEDAYCPMERQMELFELISKILSANFSFKDHDQAREAFLKLQNDIKNLNFLPFKSDEYQQLKARIEEAI